MHVYRSAAACRLLSPWTLACLAACVVTPRAVLAQNLCFPAPLALPGLSGAPDWRAPGSVRTELNEPRWSAAPLTSFANDATASEGFFRIMVDAAHTELSAPKT